MQVVSADGFLEEFGNITSRVVPLQRRRRLFTPTFSSFPS